MAPQPLYDRRALVLYGTETGNAQDVAEELGHLAERLRFNVRVAGLDDVHLKDLVFSKIVLIAISTTGQGDLPASARPFWKRLRSVRLGPTSLSRVCFASFGLGDSSYPQFNWAHRKLHNRLVQLGAQVIHERGEADEQHPEGIEGSFVPWIIKLRESLLEKFPLPDGVQPIPEYVMIEPKWLLALDDSYEKGFENGTKPRQDGSKVGDVGLKGAKVFEEEDVPVDGLVPPRGQMTAKVVENERVTPYAHWQDVRHLKFDIANTTYLPGDALAIYPKNFPSDINQFLYTQGWDSVADIPLKVVSIRPHSHLDTYPQPPKTFTDSSRPLTLRGLLTSHFDIMSIPRRSFFNTISHFTSDETQKERLLEFTDPQYVDELYDYTTRPRRSILEVLQEFETVKIPWNRALSILPAMRGRQFSIASGGALKHASPVGGELSDIENGSGAGFEQFTRVELLVAIVKYRTVIRRIRQGVCTRYITTLRPGQEITVTLHCGGLRTSPEDVSRPAIMIGPGTGVAPMRALAHEREQWRLQQSQGVPHLSIHHKDMVFFGGRNRSADFFFADEWAAMRDSLDVFPAFSRDQPRKIYVQDLLSEHAAKVRKALVDHEGTVYVCGSSGSMPRAVREALISVLAGEDEAGQNPEGVEESKAEADMGLGGSNRERAEQMLRDMEKNGRYLQETW